MKKIVYLLLACFLCLNGCHTDFYFVKATRSNSISSNIHDPNYFQQQTVLLKLENNKNPFSLNAEIFKPSQALKPKTVIIIAPGSGNISRLGEVNNNGVKNYTNTLHQVELFSQNLAKKGFFVFSYDKRTCQEKHNPLCKNSSSSVVNINSIEPLSSDLDEVYEKVSQKLSMQKEPYRIIIMGFNQAAQTIALSKSAKKASGIILISPILGPFDDIWVKGLKKASLKTDNENEKNQLLSDAESIKSFFNSLKNNDFPKESLIKGASVYFWQNWLLASNNTLLKLKHLFKPVLLVFNKNDVFFSENLTKEKMPPNIKTKIFSTLDRNFITENGPDEEVLNQIIDFINKNP